MVSQSVSWNSLHKELISFVNNKVRDKAVAEDIVQEVFIKVHTKSSQLKNDDKVIGWIYRITQNAVIDHFRSGNRKIEHKNVDWESSHHEFNDCVSHCLKVLMATLPDKFRIPLELTELENLSQLEVAKRLQLSHAGARSRVQRARKILKDKIESLFIIETDPYGNVITCENREPCHCRGC